MGIAKLERELAAAGKGCLGKAADDEPVFILRAKDKFSPKLIELWASWVENELIGAEPREQATIGSRMKVKEAKALAHTMRAWQELNGSKRPD